MEEKGMEKEGKYISQHLGFLPHNRLGHSQCEKKIEDFLARKESNYFARKF